MDDTTQQSWNKAVKAKAHTQIGPPVILIGLFCVIVGTYLLLGLGWALTIAGLIFVVLGSCAALKEDRVRKEELREIERQIRERRS